jgi:hypothetical protein
MDEAGRRVTTRMVFYMKEDEDCDNYKMKPPRIMDIDHKEINVWCAVGIDATGFVADGGRLFKHPCGGAVTKWPIPLKYFTFARECHEPQTILYDNIQAECRVTDRWKAGYVKGLRATGVAAMSPLFKDQPKKLGLYLHPPVDARKMDSYTHELFHFILAKAAERTADIVQEGTWTACDRCGANWPNDVTFCILCSSNIPGHHRINESTRNRWKKTMAYENFTRESYAEEEAVLDEFGIDSDDDQGHLVGSWLPRRGAEAVAPRWTADATDASAPFDRSMDETHARNHAKHLRDERVAEFYQYKTV